MKWKLLLSNKKWVAAVVAVGCGVAAVFGLDMNPEVVTGVVGAILGALGLKWAQDRQNGNGNGTTPPPAPAPATP